jgi:Toprim-like
MEVDVHWLTLDILERNDPRPQRSVRHTRYACPLKGCLAHEQSANIRTLSVELRTGVWHCDSCGAGGLLLTSLPAPELTTSGNGHGQHVERLPNIPPPPIPNDQPRARTDGVFARFATYQDLERSPGALYLSSRGILADLAQESGVRFGRVNGRPAVIFPVRDQVGLLVAMNARFLTIARGQPKGASSGLIDLGVFATPGALQAPRVAICEAPLDALSLATAGLPAVALVSTTSRPEWLRAALSHAQVAIATDADMAGDTAAQSVALWLSADAKPIRLRPPEAYKDWNATLQSLGRAGLTDLLSTAHSAAPSARSQARSRRESSDALQAYADPHWTKLPEAPVPDTPAYHAAIAVRERLGRAIEELRLAATAAIDPDVSAHLRAEARALQSGPYEDAAETIQAELDALEARSSKPAVRQI